MGILFGLLFIPRAADSFQNILFPSKESLYVCQLVRCCVSTHKVPIHCSFIKTGRFPPSFAPQLRIAKIMHVAIMQPYSKFNPVCTIFFLVHLNLCYHSVEARGLSERSQFYLILFTSPQVWMDYLGGELQVLFSLSLFIYLFFTLFFSL